MVPKGQHVVPRGNKWVVQRSGASRVTAIFSTQEEAIEKARKLARKERGVIYVHDKFGRIRDRVA